MDHWHKYLNLYKNRFIGIKYENLKLNPKKEIKSICNFLHIDYEETIDRSKARMAKNDQLKLIDENAQWVKEKQEEKEYPLNIDKYKAEIEKDEEVLKRFRKIADYQTDLSFKSLPYEEDLMTKDSTLREKRDRWHKNLSKDVYIEEAVNVLEDLKMNNIKKHKVVDVKG